MEYLIVGVGILIGLDIGFDIWRIWNQGEIESWVRSIDEELKALRVEFNGKTKAILDISIALADAAGYKRAKDEQAEEKSES